MCRVTPLVFFALLIIGISQAQTELPSCRYDDVSTYHQEEEDWQRSLLDTIFKLAPSYEPSDLVFVSEAGFAGDRLVRAIMIEDLTALRQNALEQGINLAIQSAHRTYNYQEQTFQYWVSLQGYDAALLTSARPGHSEHQLGTAIDFRSANGPAAWDLEDWALTPEGGWLAENAWRYGFIMSYPKGKEAITCYSYEPWHYRYVGKETAEQIKQSGLTLREWLWQRQ